MFAAQEADTEDDRSLDLFDEDVELTEDQWPQFHLRFGMMWLEGDGRISAGLPGGEEIPILDLDALGVDRTDTSYWGSLTWRSRNSRWGAWFGVWAFRSSGERLIGGDIPISESETIPADLRVDTVFDTDWYIGEITYSFFRAENMDVGIGLGVHLVDLETRLTTRLNVDGSEPRERELWSIESLAPLPNILAYAHFRLADRWTVLARVGWFSLNYDKYSGEMLNFHGFVSYELSPRWSLSAGYQFVDLDLDIAEETYTEIYDIRFNGPALVLGFSF